METKIVVASTHERFRKWCGYSGVDPADCIFVAARDHQAAELQLRGLEFKEEDLTRLGRVSRGVEVLLQYCIKDSTEVDDSN